MSKLYVYEGNGFAECACCGEDPKVQETKNGWTVFCQNRRGCENYKISFSHSNKDILMGYRNAVQEMGG